MANTCSVIHQSLSATLTTTGGKSGGSVNVMYRIHDDDLDAMPLSVYTRATSASPDPLPQRWDQYSVKGETDNAIYCRNVVLNRDTSSGASISDIWLATVTFSELDPGRTAAHAIPNPLGRPPVVWLEFENTTEPVREAVLVGIRNAAGTLVTTDIPDQFGGSQKTAGTVMAPVTSALGPLEDGLHEEVTTIILARDDNYANFAQVVSRHNTYERTLSSDDPLSIAGTLSYLPMHAKYLGMTAPQLSNENGINYYSAVTRIALGKRPFTRDIVNQGFVYYQQDLLVNTKVGSDTAEPVLLAKDGTRLADDEEGTYVSYRTRDLVPYAPLVAGIA